MVMKTNFGSWPGHYLWQKAHKEMEARKKKLTLSPLTKALWQSAHDGREKAFPFILERKVFLGPQLSAEHTKIFMQSIEWSQSCLLTKGFSFESSQQCATRNSASEWKSCICFDASTFNCRLLLVTSSRLAKVSTVNADCDQCWLWVITEDSGEANEDASPWDQLSLPGTWYLPCAIYFRGTQTRLWKWS